MLNQFQQKLQRLTYLEFEGHDRYEGIGLGLSEAELLAELEKAPANDLFLGRYTAEDIREALGRAGVLEALAEKGYPRVEIEINTREVYNHRLYVHTGVRDYEHILIELRLREGMFRPREQFIPECELGPLPMILVDWLMLQDPKREFTETRPALPEQRHPGLGILHKFIPLVMEVVRESGRKGVLDVPEHFHGALFYSRWFKFFNPEMEGRFLAMKRDLGRLPLHQVSEAFFHNCILDPSTGAVQKWSPGEQILPLGEELLRYYSHPRYAELRDRAWAENHYILDADKMARILAEGEGVSLAAGTGEENPGGGEEERSDERG
jgi:hypothetical protein